MLQRKKRRIGFVLLLLLLLMQGCAAPEKKVTDGREAYTNSQNHSKEPENKEQEEKEEASELFMVKDINLNEKTLILRNYDGVKEEQYSYTGATYVKDKYGKDLTMDQLLAGEAVTVTAKKQVLNSVQISDQVFTYNDIKNFTLDTDNRVITVGNSSYYFDDTVEAFYKNSRISLGEVGTKDTLCLKGIDKKVYSIQVINGHGTVVLQNTEPFVGGYITIGNILSLEITPEMRIEVPEGIHLMSAANDGYGGSREITVEANRENVVNLDEVKGEEPKYGMITFKTVAENTIVSIDGKPIDISQPQQLKYGTYSLSAKAEGYADWNRILMVSSPQAEIPIDFVTREEVAAAEEKAAQESAAQKKAAEEKAAKEKEEKEAIEKAVKEIKDAMGSESSNGTPSVSDLFD